MATVKEQIRKDVIRYCEDRGHRLTKFQYSEMGNWIAHCTKCGRSAVLVDIPKHGGWQSRGTCLVKDCD